MYTFIMNHVPGWPQAIDPVIRSPARYPWTTVPPTFNMERWIANAWQVINLAKLNYCSNAVLVCLCVCVSLCVYGVSTTLSHTIAWTTTPAYSSNANTWKYMHTFIMNHVPEWPRTIDPVIRSPARYLWTTVPPTFNMERWIANAWQVIKLAKLNYCSNAVLVCLCVCVSVCVWRVHNPKSHHCVNHHACLFIDWNKTKITQTTSIQRKPRTLVSMRKNFDLQIFVKASSNTKITPRRRKSVITSKVRHDVKITSKIRDDVKKVRHGVTLHDTKTFVMA